MLYLCSMEIFYANEINGGLALLDADESAHCVRVLRHRVGDEVTVVDGIGNMYRCRLSDDSPKGAAAEILETVPGWGGHSYSLNMAVCPTKNNDRFEWFVEKATEAWRGRGLAGHRGAFRAEGVQGGKVPQDRAFGDEAEPEGETAAGGGTGLRTGFHPGTFRGFRCQDDLLLF